MPACVFCTIPEPWFLCANALGSLPLIELHGEADRSVPLMKGEELVRIAKAVGAQAEQITYPGRDHGFDFSENDPVTGDASCRRQPDLQVAASLDAVWGKSAVDSALEGDGFEPVWGF